MSEDQQLSSLEKEWKNQFDRFTSPEPTREQTLQLIAKIKEVDEVEMPVDFRAELEATQSAQSMKSKVMNMFLSQWNFHGTASWFITGVVLLILAITISENSGDEMNGFIAWIKWITLLVIAVMGYAFRSKNEGNIIIEKLSYYPLIQQMFTRFIIVMGFQLAITLPLSFFIIGKASSVLYIVSSFTPIFFFGVVGFVSTMWLGQRLGLFLTLFVWLSQVLLKKQSLFLVPGADYSLITNIVLLGLSLLLLSSMILKNRLMRDMR